MKLFKYTFFAAILWFGIMLSIALVEPEDDSHQLIEVVEGDETYWICATHRLEWEYQERTGLFLDRVTTRSEKFFK